MDIASLVIGVISAIAGFIPCVNLLVILPAIAGLVMGIISFRKNRSEELPSGIALAGIILNSLPLVVMIAFLVFASFSSNSYSIDEMTIH